MILGFKKYIIGASDPWTYFNQFMGQCDSNFREIKRFIDRVPVEIAGKVVLVAGNATVNNSRVTSKSIVFLTSQFDGGSVGFLRITSLSPGIGFLIASSNGADTSTVGWFIREGE